MMWADDSFAQREVVGEAESSIALYYIAIQYIVYSYILPTRRNLEAEAQMDSSYSLATESHTGAGREAQFNTNTGNTRDQHNQRKHRYIRREENKQRTQVLMAQSSTGNTVLMGSCYQLACFTHMGCSSKGMPKPKFGKSRYHFTILSILQTIQI